MTLWYPLIEGVRIVTYPNPLEAAKCAELIERHRVTIVLAAPTFLRGYLRKAERGQMESVRLTITGAEKLPRSLAEAFEERFGKPVFEGYGLTETSPVVSVNLPDPKPSPPGETVQPSESAGFGRQNGAGNCGGNSRAGDGMQTFAARHRNALAARDQTFSKVT